MKKLLLLGAAALALVGCTNAEVAHYKALGHDAHITCYSGGRLIYDGWSSGKLRNSAGSDGWEFMDRQTGELTQASGDCVVKQGN